MIKVGEWIASDTNITLTTPVVWPDGTTNNPSNLESDPLSTIVVRFIFSGWVTGKIVPRLTTDGSECVYDSSIRNWRTATNATNCIGGQSRRAWFIKAAKAGIISSCASRESLTAFNGTTHLPSPSATIAIDVGAFYFGTSYRDVDRGVSLAKLFSESAFDIIGFATADFFPTPSGLSEYLQALEPSCQLGGGVSAVHSSIQPSTPICPSPYRNFSSTAFTSQFAGICPIASNLQFSQDPFLSPYRIGSLAEPQIRPWLVKTINGRLIGFINAMTLELNTNAQVGASVTVDPQRLIEHVSTAIRAIKAQYSLCDTILLISTVSFTSQLSGMLLDSFIKNSIRLVFALADAATTISFIDRDPMFIKRPGEFRFSHIYAPNIPIIAMPLNYDVVGDVTVTLALNSEPKSLDQMWSGSAAALIKLDSTVPDDPNSLQMIFNLQTALSETAKLKIARVSESVYGGRGALQATNSSVKPSTDGCRVGDCPVGRMVASMLLEYCPNCVGSHFNAGAIRGDLSVNIAQNGSFSRNDFKNVFPFINYVYTYWIKGADLIEVFRQMMNEWGGGSWPQQAGIRFAHTTAESKIGASAFVKPPTLLLTQIFNKQSQHWETVDLLKLYQLITVDYVVTSTVLTKYATQLAVGPSLESIVFDSLAKKTQLEGSIPLLSTFTRPQLTSCSMTIFTLSVDADDQTQWPTMESVQQCLQTVVYEIAPIQRCPNYEVKIQVAQTSVDDPTVYTCVCIASYQRSKTVSSSGTHPCSQCPKNQVKLTNGDHSCVCEQNYYLLPNYLPLSGFTCIDPTGYLSYPATDPSELLLGRSSCHPAPDCIRSTLMPEVNSTSYSLATSGYLRRGVSWYIRPGNEQPSALKRKPVFLWPFITVFVVCI